MEQIEKYSDVALAIKKGSIDTILKLIFENTTTNNPIVRNGFRTETELWDYKSDCPRLGRESESAWADFAKDVLAFHNKNGGLIFFGINDNYEYIGATTRLDSKLVNDRLRLYIGDRIYIYYHRCCIEENQKYLGVALIYPRGYTIERFKNDAPEINGKKLFLKNESAIRIGDSSVIKSEQEVIEIERNQVYPTVGQIYCVDSLFFRILAPEYQNFVNRSAYCKNIINALSNPRTSVTSLIGPGGVGKTALATWAVIESYEQKIFPTIVSVTAKDRELTGQGILPIKPTLQSYELLLNDILDITGNPDVKISELKEREKIIFDILKGSNTLIYVDNLETVDDNRILEFLDNLPEGVRAIVTSRRQRVRVSVFPIDIGGLNDDEAYDFVQSLKGIPGFSIAGTFTHNQIIKLNQYCDGLPLAIKWVLSRTRSTEEALKIAYDIRLSSGHGEQLLEFTFRRVFEILNGMEKLVMQVLSLFQQPLPIETVIVGTGLPQFEADTALTTLVSDGLIVRLFDSSINDYSYMLRPLTRTFVVNDLSKDREQESTLRKRLSNWFEAYDIKESERRVIVREIRQGLHGSEERLVDLAIGAVRRGDFPQAEQLFKQATTRNPRNWRAWREYGEFFRKQLQISQAINCYKQAVINAPRVGNDRAKIYRELGMLYKDSGQNDATELAIECLVEAINCTPEDVIALTALASMYKRKRMDLKVIELLEPIKNHRDDRTRKIANNLLIWAYENRNDLIKADECRRRI